MRWFTALSQTERCNRANMEGSDEHVDHKRRLSEDQHAPVAVAVATYVLAPKPTGTV